MHALSRWDGGWTSGTRPAPMTCAPGAIEMMPPESPLPQPSLASPETCIEMPLASVKAKDWPVWPSRFTEIVPSGRPARPKRFETCVWEGADACA